MNKHEVIQQLEKALKDNANLYDSGMNGYLSKNSIGRDFLNWHSWDAYIAMKNALQLLREGN